MTNFPKTLKLLFAITYFVGDAEGYCYIWRHIKGNPESRLSGAVVAGEENGKPVYLCSLKYEGRWVTGKLFYSKSNAKYVCHCADLSSPWSAVVDTEFQNGLRVFIAPSGCTSWTPKEKLRLRSAVVAAIGHYNEEILICRHRQKNGIVMVGNYFSNLKECYYLDGKSLKSATDAVDVLTLNVLANPCEWNDLECTKACEIDCSEEPCKPEYVDCVTKTCQPGRFGCSEHCKYRDLRCVMACGINDKDCKSSCKAGDINCTSPCKAGDAHCTRPCGYCDGGDNNCTKTCEYGLFARKFNSESPRSRSCLPTFAMKCVALVMAFPF